MLAAAVSPGVWKALADPTRRAILDLLREGPETTGRVAARFEMTRYGVMKHLRVLQQAELVLVEERGRERWNHVNPVPIRALYRRWIQPFEEPASDRLLRIKELAERRAEERSMTNRDHAPQDSETVLVEVTIAAPAAKVWDALVRETNAWWHEDFYTAAGERSFHLEPTLGGRMYEDWGGGEGQIWGFVTGLRLGAYLQVAGDSTKAFGGPCRNLMTWRLEEADGTTTLRLEHELFGQVSDKTRASLTEGWRLLFGVCLKTWVEAG